jgi:hypothetical protein
MPGGTGEINIDDRRLKRAFQRCRRSSTKTKGLPKKRTLPPLYEIPSHRNRFIRLASLLSILPQPT